MANTIVNTIGKGSGDDTTFIYDYTEVGKTVKSLTSPNVIKELSSNLSSTVQKICGVKSLDINDSVAINYQITPNLLDQALYFVSGNRIDITDTMFGISNITASVGSGLPANVTANIVGNVLQVSIGASLSLTPINIPVNITLNTLPSDMNQWNSILNTQVTTAILGASLNSSIIGSLFTTLGLTGQLLIENANLAMTKISDIISGKFKVGDTVKYTISFSPYGNRNIEIATGNFVDSIALTDVLFTDVPSFLTGVGETTGLYTDAACTTEITTANISTIFTSTGSGTGYSITNIAPFYIKNELNSPTGGKLVYQVVTTA